MIKIISTQTVSASGTFTTPPIDVRKVEGYFGITAVVTGTGTAKLEYLVPTTQSGPDTSPESYGGFIEPTGATDIGSGLTSGSYAVQFSPIPCDYIQFKVTETGGANSITITLYVVIKV